MKKYLRITEMVWLGLAIFLVCLTAYLFIAGRQDEATMMMIFTAFAGVMYSMRRRFNRHVARKEAQVKDQATETSDKK
jgi:hypothetical protein